MYFYSSLCFISLHLTAVAVEEADYSATDSVNKYIGNLTGQFFLK